jgi:pyrroloquinoline quinone (PQQ) biosynthesis protein C
MHARAFLAELRQEVLQHPAVGHSLLARMAMDPVARDDLKVFSAQHYPLVGTFTRYLELLLLNAPDSEGKTWLAKVLVDEYGERSEGQDHAAHYRIFMAAAGWRAEEMDAQLLHPAIPGFIHGHLRLCANAPFLEGLGAVGPGHEWAIPAMFERIIVGLRRAGFREEEIGYFTLHCDQDQDHGAWLEEALAQAAEGDAAQAAIRAGCLASLAAREQLWWGIADRIKTDQLRRRFPKMASSTAGVERTWLDLKTFRAASRITVAVPDLPQAAQYAQA